MNPPRQAFILAAGFGTRLLPLTNVVPKPLLPLGGVPMIDRALAMVKAWGVRDVVINLHHGADKILRHLLDRPPDGLTINLSFEPEILGTGGALVKASWFFKHHEPFWIVNADVAADVDGRVIARAFRPGKTMAAAWLISDRGPRTVECRNGVITNFASKRAGAPGTYTFCGVHLVDPRILDYLPRDGFASIVPAYEKAMRDGWRVAGVPLDRALWADIGTPAQYVEANELVGRGVPPSRDDVRIVNGVILAPGIPQRTYAGIMVLRAEDALEPAALALAKKWSSHNNLIACPLAPRGSSRSFTRLYAGRDTAMLVTHDPARTENNLYATHARFLRRLGMSVPRVLREDARHHTALFEDVGSLSVQDLAPAKSPAWLESLYRRVIDQLVIFHERGYRAANARRMRLMPPFDDKLYAWEHDLFADLFLRGRCGASDMEIKQVKRELQVVARALMQARPALVHRDLQSSNILVRGARWSLIDFQGMRFGPAAYDLASLLLDPYIRIGADLRARLLAHYAEQADPASRVTELFWLAGIQRLGQALGAYARLGQSRYTARFLAYIPPALANLAEALEHTGEPARFKALRARAHGSSAGICSDKKKYAV